MTSRFVTQPVFKISLTPSINLFPGHPFCLIPAIFCGIFVQIDIWDSVSSRNILVSYRTSVFLLLVWCCFLPSLLLTHLLLSPCVSFLPWQFIVTRFWTVSKSGIFKGLLVGILSLYLFAFIWTLWVLHDLRNVDKPVNFLYSYFYLSFHFSIWCKYTSKMFGPICLFKVCCQCKCLAKTELCLMTLFFLKFNLYVVDWTTDVMRIFIFLRPTDVSPDHALLYNKMWLT